MNNKILFPYYSGNIKLTKSMGFVSLEKFISAHKTPTKANDLIFKQLRICEDPKEKRLLKHKLSAFTPSVVIHKGYKRKYSNISEYTGIMQVDLDGIDDYKMALEIKEWAFNQPECITSYLSPSNNVKALIRIAKPTDQEHYIRLHNAVTEKYEETGFFDTATKNAVLPLFLSKDYNIKFREYEEATVWKEEKIIEIKHEQLNDLPPPNFNSLDQSNNYNKTIRIVTNKISLISSNGHPQVRSASLILGSRVGANYLSKSDALICISNLIKQNSYLSKGVKGYLETAEWGINQGINKPKYY